MSFELPPLPFERDALEPHISARALELHYGRHHKGYVHNLNRLTEGLPEAEMSLEEVIRRTGPGPIFNNAAQAWNHTFFWSSLAPTGGGEPKGELAAAIERDFGSYETFKEGFTRAALSLFGSGWAWLVVDNGKLVITQTAVADTPMMHGQKPLLTLDVWEHAYYVDYQNARTKFVDAFLSNLVNWDFAGDNFANGARKEAATAEGRG